MRKIFILHGWTYSIDMWKKFSALLAKNGFNPIFLKIPGLTEPTDKVWDVDKYADWLNEKLVKEKLPVTLLGHSNGGRIATYFSAKYPKKVGKLILIDSAGIYHKELFLQIKRFIFEKVSKIGKKITKSDALKNLLYSLAGEHDYQKAAPNMKLSMVNLTHHDIAPFLPKVKASTLIVWGSEDKITPLSDATVMHKLIKNSKLKIIAGAKHSPFYTHPDKLIKIIKDGI